MPSVYDDVEYSRVSNNRTASFKRTYWKTRFHMACKEGQFDVDKLFQTFSIDLNALHVNGMTPFDLALSTVIRYSRGGLQARG